jgi:hypothetical protein
MLCGPRNGRVAVNQVDLGGQSALGGVREEQDVPSRCHLFDISQQLDREGFRCYFEQTSLDACMKPNQMERDSFCYKRHILRL